jgi:hypothetical protein
MRHVAEFRPDAYSILHPLICRPNLHDCPVQAAARRLTAPPVLGRAVVEVDPMGELRVVRPARDDDIEKGPDVDAMLTAFRAVDAVSRLRSMLRAHIARGEGKPVLIDAARVLAELEETAEGSG